MKDSITFESIYIFIQHKLKIMIFIMLKFTYSFSAVKVIIALHCYYLLFFSCQGHNSLALFSNLLSKLLIGKSVDKYLHRLLCCCFFFFFAYLVNKRNKLMYFKSFGKSLINGHTKLLHRNTTNVYISTKNNFENWQWFIFFIPDVHINLWNTH